MTDPPSPPQRERARADLATFLDGVDRRTDELAARHAGRIRCGQGCADCCRDELSVFEIEADRIQRDYEKLLREDRPHSQGACAFLDANRCCRIYPDRPYICRTQGLPMRWFADPQDGEPAEYRDICPLNLDGPALEDLEADACWLLGPDEARLKEIATRFSAGPPQRVKLRELFRSDS